MIIMQFYNKKKNKKENKNSYCKNNKYSKMLKKKN